MKNPTYYQIFTRVCGRKPLDLVELVQFVRLLERFGYRRAA